MMNYPIADRREFALWAHASTCFRNAAEACSIVIDRKLTPFDPLYKPLSAYAVIEYSKPFKRSSELGRVPELVIPEGHNQLHELVIRVRDKIAAHLDTRGMPGHDPHLHNVRIYIHANGQVEYFTEEPKIPQKYLPEFKTLSLDLAKKAQYYVEKHLKKLVKIIERARMGYGEYLIDLNESSKALRKLAEHEKAQLFWNERE